MKVFSQLCYVIGVMLLIDWMIQMMRQEELSSFQGMQNAMSKTKVWAFSGFACFWLPGIFYWIMSGMKINFKQVNGVLIESTFPSFSRVIPTWVQLIRMVGLGFFIYFNASSIKLVDGDLVFSFEYYWVMALGGLLFFGLPFLFPKKDDTQ